MKRAVLLAALIMMAGLSAGKVGYDGPKDQPHIMGAPSGSSASASTAVGPNGTEWRAEVSERASVCRSGNQTAGITNITYSGQDKKKVSFNGQIETPNPCHTVDHEVTESNGTYIMNIKTQSTGEACVQCVGMVEYSAKFETGEAFKLKVQHDGETVDTLEHPDFEEDRDGEDSSNRNSGLITGFFSWLKGLF